MERALRPVSSTEDETSTWALQFGATTRAEPVRLVQTLSGAIFGCGGWVLSRASNDAGLVHMAFEFERHACEDIYSLLVAAGLEISHAGHSRLIELCQCTRMSALNCHGDIVSIDLEIEAIPAEFQGT